MNNTHSNLIEIKSFDFSFFNCYKVAEKITENTIALKFEEISAYGAIITLIDTEKNEHQLTKKKVKWSDIINSLGLMSYRDIDVNKEKVNFYKSEIQKHGIILVTK